MNRPWRVVWESKERGREWVDAENRATVERRLLNRPGGWIERYIVGRGWVAEGQAA